MLYRRQLMFAVMLFTAAVYRDKTPVGGYLIDYETAVGGIVEEVGELCIELLGMTFLSRLSVGCFDIIGGSAPCKTLVKL